MSRLIRTVLFAALGGGLLGIAAASARDQVMAYWQVESHQSSPVAPLLLVQQDGSAPEPPRRPRMNEDLPVPPRYRDRIDPPPRSSTETPRGQQAAPVRKPQSREEMLEDLYKRLAEAKDQNEANGIVRNIESLWRASGSDTADLLMTRAQEAIRNKKNTIALRLFDRIVEIQPSWAEGWNQRATVRFRENDLDGAIADIGKVLAIEPRHFRALSGLGFVMKREGFNAQALKAFRKALEVNPQQENIRKQVEQLTIKVEGRGI